jgi:heme-degrading monooxygenase HmoA
MILEHALLNVRSGQESDFESAMQVAKPLISATPGFLGLEVRPCLERPGLYLLLVRWETVEAHEIGFRKSERYPEWARLLHRFYEPFPEVLHFGDTVA